MAIRIECQWISPDRLSNQPHLHHLSMGLTIRETSCTPKRVLTLPHCNWYNLSGVKETILRGYWHPAFSPIDVLSQMLTTARSSSQFTADKMQAGSRKQRQVNLYVASSPVMFFSFSMHPYILYLFPYGMVSIETEVAQKKKTVTRLS